MKRVKWLTRSRVFTVLAVVLLAGNIVFATLWLQVYLHTNPTVKYPFIDIAREYIPQEHFIINIQPLREKLNEIVKQEGANTVSIYFEFLNSGANIQINNETRFYPASLVKVPCALAVMKKVEAGDWSLDDRLVLLDQDKDNRYGTLYQQPTNTSFSIRDLLEKLLVESDNTAHKILMRNLSEDELNVVRDAVGLNDLFDEKSEVSAKEYSRLFRALYNSSFLKRDNSQQLLQWLSSTSFNQYLPAGLPSGTVFAHKIGEDDVENNYHDSGIVYLPNRPYLITVMIKQHDQTKAKEIMSSISQATYEYISSYE
jgi:beta-lactamase class A